jgi:medium-chain acyl-[acyl-carrier-protein] hydrolase
MTTFKQWHDDTLKFHNEMKLYFCQCDMNQRINFSELLRLSTDTAVEDYYQRGMSWQFLADHDVGILLSRISFRFHIMPKVNDFITISTTEEEPEPLQLMRTYEITAADGTRLVSGYGSWLIVNPKTRRIIRTKDFTLRAAPNTHEMHNCMEPGKIAVPENMTLLDEREIRYTDIDGNGHMDNSRYGTYVMDSLPETYQQRKFTDFRMNYSKEAKLGEHLNIFGFFDNEAKKITIIGKHNDVACFESELYYK